MLHMERITTIVKLNWNSILCHYSDAYILVSVSITIDGAGADCKMSWWKR